MMSAYINAIAPPTATPSLGLAVNLNLRLTSCMQQKYFHAQLPSGKFNCDAE